MLNLFLIDVSSIWIGGSKTAEGNWQWISESCSFSSYANWLPDEPSGRAGEVCLGMVFGSHGVGWNDGGGSFLTKSVCVWS